VVATDLARLGDFSITRVCPPAVFTGFGRKAVAPRAVQLTSDPQHLYWVCPVTNFGHSLASSFGMKPPTEIRTSRAALEAKLAELTAAFQDRSGLTIENSADMLDTIRMATDRDVLVQQLNISAEMLSDVREALGRLDRGAYGLCEDCEESISPRRLHAIPWARVCVKCQEARDHNGVDAGDTFSMAA
jgi:DnaK suppressor protein